LLLKVNTATNLWARERLCMATCEVCENEYDKAFEVVVAGKRHTFDSFECAIHRWRRFAHISIAGLSGTALKLTDKFSAASTARARPAKRS
jgi:hypothetical protein